eukprot:gene8468-13060_t
MAAFPPFTDQQTIGASRAVPGSPHPTPSDKIPPQHTSSMRSGGLIFKALGVCIAGATVLWLGAVLVRGDKDEVAYVKFEPAERVSSGRGGGAQVGDRGEGGGLLVRQGATQREPIVLSATTARDIGHLAPIDFREVVAEDFTVPDSQWPGGPSDWYAYRSVANKAASVPASSPPPGALSTAWKGTPPDDVVTAANVSTAHPHFPAGVFYFYDDIANHSVFLLQKSLEIVEPTVPQYSMYVAPQLKTFGWSYPVKMNFIINAIKANWQKVIVVIDTDMVFYRPWALKAARLMDNNDIVFQGVDSYAASNPKEQTKMRKSITIAIVVIKCNEKSLALFRTVLNKITCNGRWIKNRIDQTELLNVVSRMNGLRWGVLPREFWGPAMSRTRCQMPAQPVMCHPDKKKGDQGGQWAPWHRKTEWKFHHIISQHCMGLQLITPAERGDWWHPYSLIAGISTLVTPRSNFIHPAADVFVYSPFTHDDWSRLLFQITLKAAEPSLGSQFVDGALSLPHVLAVLASRPLGSMTYFALSTTLFFRPFASHAAAAAAAAPSGVVHAGLGFFAVRKTGGPAPAEADLAEFLGGRGSRLAHPQYVATERGTNATEDTLVCVVDTLRHKASFPHWHTPRGVVGYLTLDEQAFHLAAYQQCGKPYS